MTEVIAMIAVGVGISGLILNGQRNIREEMRNSEVRLREEANARSEKIEGRLEKIEGRLGVWSFSRRSWKGCWRGCGRPYRGGRCRKIRMEKKA